MPLYYSLVARRKLVLCDHAAVAGSFESLTQSVLEQLPLSDMRTSYECGRYLVHVSVAGGLAFLCVTERRFERAMVFEFLSAVQRTLRERGLEQQAKLAGPYALRPQFSSTLAELMTRFSSGKDGVASLREKVRERRAHVGRRVGGKEGREVRGGTKAVYNYRVVHLCEATPTYHTHSRWRR